MFMVMLETGLKKNCNMFTCQVCPCKEDQIPHNKLDFNEIITSSYSKYSKKSNVLEI